MRKSILFSLLLLPAGAFAQLAELQQAYNSAAAKAGPAVVSVQVIKEETQSVLEPDYYFGYDLPTARVYRYKSEGVGSGVIVDKRGYVLTNRHVVEDSVRIRVVTQDARGVEKEWLATVTGTDPALDLAVLKIRANGAAFPYLDLDTAGQPKVGDFVLAVGYPFGFKQTVTSGIISAVNASLPVEGRRMEKLIQTDAAINHGNSGGPLLNLKGEVIGINSAIASPTGVFAGMGFAIPASEIKRVLDDLLAGREIKRGWLGLSLLAVDPVMAARLGLEVPEGGIVNEAVPGSPAYKAGLRRGDIVLSCDGREILTHEDLFSYIYGRRPGDEVELVYLRKGAKRTARVRLGERGGEAGAAASAPGAAPREQAGRFEWQGAKFAYEDGAKVVSVGRDSALAGRLRPGDVVQAVNGARVDSPAAMAKVFSGADLADGVLFDLVRDGKATYLSVQAK